MSDQRDEREDERETEGPPATHADPGGNPSGNPSTGAGETSETEQRLAALLGDLETLRQYLDQRGRHTYELAQRFLANAARDPGSRQYDERQATMLEYQHYIWHEIAGRIAQLLDAYAQGGADAGAEAPLDAGEEPPVSR